MSYLMCKTCKYLFGNAHVQEAFPEFKQECPRCKRNNMCLEIRNETNRQKAIKDFTELLDNESLEISFLALDDREIHIERRRLIKELARKIVGEGFEVLELT